MNICEYSEQFVNSSTTGYDWNVSQSGEKPWSAWRQPGYVVTLLVIAYSVVAVVGVLNNGLVIAVVFYDVSMRTITNFFLANLAVADILVCVFVLPITLLQNIYTEWWYGDTVCRWAPYLQGVAVGASVNTLAAVAVERYLEVFHSTTAKMTPRTALCVIFVIWLFPGFIFVPWIFVYGQRTFIVAGRYEYVACHAEWSSMSMLRAFTMGVVFLTCYVLPLVCIGVFYAMIAARVWRRRVGQLAVKSRAAANIQRSKTRLLRMLVTIVVLFAVSWLPLYAINLWRVFADPPPAGSLQKRLLEHYIGPLAQWLGASNSCVNPFVYCYFSHGFRVGVASLLRNVVCRSTSASRPTQLSLEEEQRPAARVNAPETIEVKRCVTVINEDDAEIVPLSTFNTNDLL